jgi:mannose-6-phosphate isomerase-like protein (cupin superfamily)
MLKRNKDMRTEVKHQLRGGSGCVDFIHIFETGDLHAKSRLIANLKLQPGCSIGVHEHIDEEEIYYVLKGSGTLIENGKEQLISAGDAALTKSGASHSIENRGKEPLEMLAIILLY